MKLSDSISTAAKSLKSIVKIILQSRRHTISHIPEDEASRPLIIMGNGPSLADTIRLHSQALHSNPTLAVNFAANAPEFTSLKPRYYLLADPHFFTRKDDANVARLTDNLATAVTWEMTLFVPVQSIGSVASGIKSNPAIKIETFNAVGVEGWQWLEGTAFRSGRGMPRPRNVLIPSIMVGILMGYRQIYITGADHSWTRTISVNDRNEVVSIQPHFYKEDKKEIERVRTDYLRYPLHQIPYSFYVAFKSYFAIARHASRIGVEIYNATPESFIDAFPRKPLP